MEQILKGTLSPNRQPVLDAMPGTRAELGRRTGLSKSTLFSVVQMLSDERKTHISHYMTPKNGGCMVPVYVAGPGLDAEQPIQLGIEDELARRSKALRRVDRQIKQLVASGQQQQWWSPLERQAA